MNKVDILHARWLKLLIVAVVLALALVGFMVWSHLHEDTAYEACVRAGNRVLTSYPSICVTKDGKQYADPHEFVKDSPL